MPRLILKTSLKGYTYDQDKTVDPLSTSRKAVEGLSRMYDLSNVHLQRRLDAVTGAFSYSSLSDQLQASGKGLTNEQAQASASMEFAERYSWLHFDYANYDGYKVETYEELSRGSDPTVEPGYFLENFIGVKDKKGKTAEIMKIPLKWIKGFSLTLERDFYYPINWHNMVIGSNGLSAGNTLEEAIIQGLCEVIERENLFRFFVERRPVRDLELKSIENPLLKEVLTNARQQGIEFTVKDISYDFRVTTFIVRGISQKDKGNLAYKGVGQGAATDPEKALIRALAEYFESYSLTRTKEAEFKEKLGEDMSKYLDKFPKRHMGFHAFFNPQLLDQKTGTVKLQDLRNYGHPDIKSEIEEQVEDLRRKKFNVTIIDKTHPQLKIPALRVFVPGMRNMINCEIESPDFALAEIYYEARDLPKAQKYFDATMSTNRDVKKMAAGVSVKKIFEKDYLKNMVKLMHIKKSAIDTVKEFQEMIKNIERRQKGL